MAKYDDTLKRGSHDETERERERERERGVIKLLSLLVCAHTRRDVRL